MRARRIAFLGNCQVTTYAALAPQMVEGAQITYLDYSTTDSREEHVRAAFVDTLESCDAIFAQTALLSLTNERALKDRFGDKVVTIANFYFRGLFPDSCYVGAFGERIEQPSAVNSVIVLDAFLRGCSPQQAIASFNRENYERLNLLNAWELSMDEMRRREAHGVDVPGAAMMEDACRRYPAFLTMNHPSILLLAEYLSRAFTRAELPHTQVNAATLTDPLADHDTTPVDDVVAEALQLSYRGTQCWRINSLGRRFVDKEEYVNRFYDGYAQHPREALVIHSPTDMVERYAATPDLRFLVDPASAMPNAPAGAWVQPKPTYANMQLTLLLDSIMSKTEETRHFMHKVHSYASIADPKIEAISYRLAHWPEPAAPPAGVVPQAAAVSTGQYRVIVGLLIVLVILVGLLVIRLI
jgi:Polysaccharide biosynthesis enzyme WcbI